MPEARDGRGQLLPVPWYMRVVLWLRANPVWGLVGLLLAGFGASRIRIGHLEAKQARAQKKADLSALERNQLKVKERERSLETRIVVADAKVKKAEKADAAAKVDFDAAQKDLKGVADRWKKKKS